LELRLNAINVLCKQGSAVLILNYTNTEHTDAQLMKFRLSHINSVFILLIILRKIFTVRKFCQEYKHLGVIFDTSGTDDKEIKIKSNTNKKMYSVFKRDTMK
jgi:hypothetical protein